MSGAGPLEAGEIARLVADEPWISQIVIRERVDSTNDLLRRLSDEGAPEGTVVLAGEQTAGRGTRGRSWFSPPGLGLYVSVLLRPVESAPDAPRWTLAAGLAACEAALDAGAAGVQIEWPNDLVWNLRKVAGTLTEMRSAGGVVKDVVVGTGFNVGHRRQDFPPDLAATAGSLREACGGIEPRREVLAARFLLRFADRVRRIRRDGWEALAADWLEHAPGAQGSKVRVLATGGASYEATTAGIAASGALRVVRQDGREAVLAGGESVVALGG